MKLLKCKLCAGECDIIGNDHGTNKQIKCRDCGYSNEFVKKEPEVFIFRKRVVQE